MSIRYSCTCGKVFSLEDQFLGKLVRCPFCGEKGIAQIGETLSDIEKEAAERFTPPIPQLTGTGLPRGSADRWVEQPGFHSQVIYSALFGGIAICAVVLWTFLRFIIYAPDAIPPQLSPYAQHPIRDPRPTMRFLLPNNAKPKSLAVNWINAAGQRISKREMQRQLSITAADAALFDNYSEAITKEYAAIELGAGSYYDLARYYALNKQYPEALHWLEQSFDHEYIIDDELDNETAFLPLQKDLPEEWNSIIDQHENWMIYYFDHYVAKNLLITPAKYSSTTPMPLLVILAESGTAPLEVMEDFYTQLANQKQIAILIIGGPDSFALEHCKWDFKDPLRNQRHIQGAILGLDKRLKIDTGKVLLVGVGDSATIGLEMALAKPAIFGGCLAIFPSDPPDLNAFLAKGPKKEHLSQVYSLLINSPDSADPNQIDEKFAARLREEYLATCTRQILPKEGADGRFPTDFSPNLVEWLNSVLQAQSADHP